MALDGRLLARAKARLEEAARQHEAVLAKRQEEVYAAVPRVRTLDNALKASVIDVIGVALKNSKDPSAAIADIRDANLSLQEERVRALRNAGFPADYLDDAYRCATCRDTGYVGTEICSCLAAFYKEEQAASLSSLYKLGEETFERFDLSWYDNAPDALSGISPREQMTLVFETCADYAARFDARAANLYLSGGTGLGKTFLSACIARVVSEKGYSVVYETASAVFSTFEEEKFSKNVDLSSSREEIRRYLGCDLLILDDLGTEMTTSFTVSALYELVNTRLNRGKKTIISSNLPADELRSKYSQQIASRIEGDYHVLNFCGRDIRLLKKGL
ncbi:ATP-binding protein [Oscillospiraceae bacterium CM]|nr:ATP-binding protein [Oscillospiraceae bacterium CM]